MAIGITQKHEMVMDVLKSTQSISKMVEEQKLYPDDLEKMIGRLHAVQKQIEAKASLETFITTVKGLQKLDVALPIEMKDKGKELAALFPEHPDLKQFAPRKSTIRNVVVGSFLIGKQEFDGKSSGNVSKEVKAAIEAYNNLNSTVYTAKDLRKATPVAHDFKFISD